MKRVLLTGDVFRPVERRRGLADAAFRSSQKGNIRWLYHLLRRPIAAATGLPVSCILWGEGFDTELFYQLMDVEPSLDGWAQITDSKLISPEALAIIGVAFESSIVVGFEMPNILMNSLSRLGIAWINFLIGPVRCLSDLMFACLSNSATVFDAMTAFHHPFSEFEAEVDLMRATFARSPWPNVPHGLPLVVGQTGNDRVLLCNGRFVNLADYPQVFSDRLFSARGFIFKPHPYNPDDFGIYNLGIPLSRIHKTDVNIYALLSFDKISEVICVSSSVGIEAELFEKEVTWLKGPPMNLNRGKAPIGYPSYLSFKYEPLGSKFWASILSSLIKTRQGSLPEISYPPNTLRNSMQSFWGYPLETRGAKSEN